MPWAEFGSTVKPPYNTPLNINLIEERIEKNLSYFEKIIKLVANNLS